MPLSEVIYLIFAVLLKMYAVFVLFYFIFVNGVYVLLMAASFRAVVTYLRRNRFCDYRVIIQSEYSTPISVLVPAYNEAATIIDSVNSLLKLNYSSFEVVVVNDGSRDETFKRMEREFGLRRSHIVYEEKVAARRVRGIFVSERPEFKNLVVVDKMNGGKADALNVGINVARYPLVCAIDADSILEDDALLKVVKPYLEDETVIAVGGIVRIANGCDVERGRVKTVRLSRKAIPIFQVVEYLRAFLSGRMGWSALNGLMIVSGAFGLFRKDAVIDVGGYLRTSIGEDMELITRLHRHFTDRRIPYRIVFVPDPVCWTEAPESLRVLGRQRNRWHRGLLDTLIIHRKVLFNPEYGVIGLLAAPYFFIVELLGPLIEGFGYVALAISFWLGFVNEHFVLLFFIVAIIYGVMFSVGAVLLEEMSFRRYPKPTDLARLLFFAVIENFGYRQLTVWWRAKAFWDYWRGVKSWGAMERKGFARRPTS